MRQAGLLPNTPSVTFHQVISALRASGHTVVEDAETVGLYKVNAGPSLSLEAVMILAWQLGLITGPGRLQ